MDVLTEPPEQASAALKDQFSRTRKPTTDMNYDANDMGAVMWGVLDVPANLAFEDFDFDEPIAWSTSNGGVMDSNGSLGELAQMNGTFEGLSQEFHGYSNSLQPGSGGTFGQVNRSCHEPLQPTEMNTISVEFPSMTTPSASAVVPSPVVVQAAALQPLLERIEALEAAQSTPMLSGVLPPGVCSQNSGSGDGSPRAISRITKLRTSRLVP